VPKPFSAEFRRDVIAVARTGEGPISQIARDFGMSESCLQRWLKLADASGVDYMWLLTGQRPGGGGGGIEVRHQGLEPRTR
jgi:transposase